MIKYIANIRFPTEKAHGIQIAKMCEAFTDSNKELELILPSRINNIKISAFEYYSIKRNFQLTTLKTYDPRWLLKLPAGYYIKLQAWFFTKSLKKYLNDNLKINDVIFTRDEYLLPFLNKFVKNHPQFHSKYTQQVKNGKNKAITNQSNYKIINEVHNLPRRAAYYSKYWNKCHSIIAINKTLKEDLIKAGVKSNIISVLHDAVDINKFDIKISKQEARKITSLPLNKKTAITNSSLHKWKGIYTLVNSIKYLPNEWIVVIIGGPKSEEQKLKKYIKEKKIPTNKIFIQGHRPYSEIPYYLKSADVLILPSSNQKSGTNFNVRYTSPLKAFEYLASGKPIVAANIPAIHEIFGKEKINYYKPDNAKNLADTILLYKNSDEVRLNKISWKKRVDKIIKLINTNQ